MQKSMHEYIKKLSFSLCMLSQVVKDVKFKEEFELVQMSLIKMASHFYIEHGKGNLLSRNTELREFLIRLIDILDLAKFANVVSAMNAEVIISSVLRLIEEVDSKILHEKSYLLPKLELSEMSDRLLRERARENNQNRFLSQNKNPENQIFNFTNIPTLDNSEAGVARTVSEFEQGEKIAAEKERGDVESKKDEPKFDWGNGTDKKPLVYTFFGSEDKIIEDRKIKLLEVLKVGGGVAIGDISKQFPGLNPKTIQRDLLDLMREKKVIMLGTKRWAKYYLK